MTQYLAEMILVGITDYNELLWNSQKCIELFRVVLKIALTAFVKYEIIGAGIVAVIRNYKICKIMVTDSVQPHIPDPRYTGMISSCQSTRSGIRRTGESAAGKTGTQYSYDHSVPESFC